MIHCSLNIMSLYKSKDRISFTVVLKSLIQILAPKCCFACQRVLSQGEKTLCTYCRHQLSLTQFNFCIENECDKSFYGKTQFVKASALFYMDQSSVIKQVIHQLKYRDQEHLGLFLADWAASILKRDPCLIHFDYLTIVPLHWRKKHRRGYNQLELFSKRLSKLMGWNYAPKLLKRIHYQKSQTKKSRVNRAFNSNPFVFHSNLNLTNRRILIVDDIITTGSTMAHCANAVLKASPCSIYFLSIGFRSRFV